MKRQLLIISTILLLILITNISATNLTSDKIQPIKLCKINVDIRTATEQTSIITQVQAFQNITIQRNITVLIDKQVTKKVLDYESSKADIDKFKIDNLNYLKSKDKNKVSKPTIKLKFKDVTTTIKSPSIITNNTIIQVPLMQNITKYKIDFLGLQVLPYQVQVPVYVNQTTNSNKLKDGYTFDESTGEFYTMSNCGGVKK